MCPATLHFTTVRASRPTMSRSVELLMAKAISEGHGDAAVAVLKAGAETTKRDVDGHLAIELAPDSKVPVVEL